MVASIFGQLGDKAESAIVPLTEFISNKESPESRVICAVVALGAIGPKARTAVPALLALPKGRFDIPIWSDDALAAMGAPEVLPRLIQRLDRPGDHRVFYDIASLKEKGREAGPALLRCLRENRFGTRTAPPERWAASGMWRRSPTFCHSRGSRILGWSTRRSSPWGGCTLQMLSGHWTGSQEATGIRPSRGGEQGRPRNSRHSPV